MKFSFMTPSPWLQSLEGKHVLITGGSSGIGCAIAKEALSQGAFVTLVARSSTKLEKAEQNLDKDGATKHKISTKVADVGVYETLAKAIKESFEWRAVDVLVCNAGVGKTGLLDESRIEDLHAIIQTNLTGVVNTLHIGIPLMKQRSPQTPMSIVLMNSLSGLYFLYGNSVYTATKHALKGLGETLKLELMPYSIRISMVFPGYVDTPMLDDSGMEDDRDTLQMIKATTFYNRHQAKTPEQVAKYTLEATKNGTFLVTSKFGGLMLSTLSRGPMPAGTLGRALVELILYIPIRLLSFLAFFYVHYVTGHRKNKKC
ncbi:3-dehydrosphinganine reductase TSC10A isoform X1 [Cryptomeria japonica]|uniref:3-dehydrosphinganine reductase TSC10A isoform X1 n=1 Tax=Cryptomeria japonica TaxID=3369 RepID=UPI0027DA5597|nr:3-dehydrosphinganine reductase TSC10A isoform X1 [Cryptomeria japonica]